MKSLMRNRRTKLEWRGCVGGCWKKRSYFPLTVTFNFSTSHYYIYMKSATHAKIKKNTFLKWKLYWKMGAAYSSLYSLLAALTLWPHFLSCIICFTTPQYVRILYSDNVKITKFMENMQNVRLVFVSVQTINQNSQRFFFLLYYVFFY